MAHLFQTFRNDGTPHPVWRIEYRDWEGRKRKRTGFKSKAESERLARHLQAEQDAIRKGLRPPPKPSDTPHDFQEVVGEYLAWGRMQGGRGGRPWAPDHLRKRKAQLAWW